MAASVHKDFQGPDWPLGSIAVATPGTPVGLMSLVDPGNYNDPGTPSGTGMAEYTQRCNQIIFQGFKNNGTTFVANVGNIYVMRKGAGGGAGNRSDPGACVLIIPSGQTGVIGSAALNRNDLSPYRYYIDADNIGDAAQVTLLIF